MRRYVLVTILLASTVCLGILCCGRGRQTGFLAPNPRHGVLQGVLVRGSESWTASNPLALWFMLYNGSQETIRVDGRLHHPGNIDLYVELPDRRKLLVTPMKINLVSPDESDIVELPRGRLYGSVIEVSMGDQLLAKELRAARPGRYIFWAEYHGTEARKIGVQRVMIRTNTVAVTIE